MSGEAFKKSAVKAPASGALENGDKKEKIAVATSKQTDSGAPADPSGAARQVSVSESEEERIRDQVRQDKSSIKYPLVASKLRKTYPHLGVPTRVVDGVSFESCHDSLRFFEFLTLCEPSPLPLPRPLLGVMSARFLLPFGLAGGGRKASAGSSRMSDSGR